MYIYNKTSIKRNILTIKQIDGEVGRAKDLSSPWYECPTHCLYVTENVNRLR
jgi:hypothetical protein